MSSIGGKKTSDHDGTATVSVFMSSIGGKKHRDHRPAVQTTTVYVLHRR